MATIRASVGNGGVNHHDDVTVIQVLLNRNIARLAPLPPLGVTGECDAATVEAITQFQRKVVGVARPDGRVDPDGQTLTKLNESEPRSITLTGVPLAPPAARVLTEILETAGLVTARVTSVERTPAEQARVMYENCNALGAAHNKALYGPAGDEVVQVFSDNAGKERDVVIALMLAKIQEVGPTRVSMHISETHYVFDVAPSSIPEASRARFVEAIHRHPAVSKLIAPPVDPAYHVEIPRSRVG